MRWSFIGLKHAVSPFFFTSEGLGTYFQLISGRQVLYVANPRSEGHLAEIACFIFLRDGQAIVDSADWEITEQILEPGSIWWVFNPSHNFAITEPGIATFVRAGHMLY